MKKMIAFVMALVMCMTALAGCGNGTTTGSEGDKQTGKKGDKGKIVFIATQLGDMSFNDNGWDGVQKIGEKYGYDVSVIETGMDSSKYETMFLDICDSNADYIIAQSGNGWGDIVFKHAGDYPEKKFIVFDASITTEVNQDNVVCIAYKQNEGSFLVGYVCAAMSQSGVIAAGANRDNPAINDFFTGFVSGAQERRKDIKISLAYNSTPGDAAAMGEIATALYNSGVDVMFSVAGAAGLGIFQAAVEKDKLAVGVDSDQYLTYSKSEKPELAKVIMTSMVKDIGGSLMKTFDMIDDGSIKWGNLMVLGIAEKGVLLADNENYQKIVPEEIRKEIEELQTQVASGEVKIPSYYDFEDDAEFRQLVNSVAP